ncbi:hypothetical protein SAMN06265173_1713 [Thalassovita litoralis]|jgi:hypothetical protein|uniref:Uncharacterized protein n=1 Tax=Thalassovita litoralis TaxID=1010611 RepID=A0A521FW52_9RHOB|nr:hypothetical protein SAMN06265173_1713 [Thalassovita litoralis]
MREVVDQFWCLGESGRKYEVLIVLDTATTMTAAGGRLNTGWGMTAQLSDNRQLEWVKDKDGTFIIPETGEIIRRVSDG